MTLVSSRMSLIRPLHAFRHTTLINSFRECQIFANDSNILDFITPCHALRGVKRSVINKRLIFGREEYYSKLNWASRSRSQTWDSGQLTVSYLDWKVNNLLKGLNELQTDFSNTFEEWATVTWQAIERLLLCQVKFCFIVLIGIRCEYFFWALVYYVFSVFLIAFNQN